MIFIAVALAGIVLVRLDRVCHGWRMGTKTNPFLVASLMNGGGDQTLFHLTLATAVVVALMIFVAGFLLGLCCGCMRRRQQTRLQAAVELKRRARA